MMSPNMFVSKRIYSFTFRPTAHILYVCLNIEEEAAYLDQAIVPMKCLVRISEYVTISEE